MTKTVLVVVAHPDDEVLGCGGTIARHAFEGDNVHVVFMTTGVGSRGDDPALGVQARLAAKTRALEILGVCAHYSFDFPDNRMDEPALLDIVQPLEDLVHKLQPSTVYTHHHGDLNIDHRITHQAVLTACRPQPLAPIKEVLAFEIVSSTEWSAQGQAIFLPNVFIDVSAYWHKKAEAMQAYHFEMRPAPHSRSVQHMDALSIHRGACVGLTRAEAFSLVRRLQ